MSEAELSKLSGLQKALLKKGLEAHCARALDHVYRIEPEGSFGIKTMLKEVEDRRERARRRASAGRSIERSMGRGHLESCSWGRWRLTANGVTAARKLFPETKELTYQAAQVGLPFDPCQPRGHVSMRPRKAELVQVLVLQIPAFLKQRFTIGESASQKAHILQSDLEFTVMTSR
jgi:hypothetical protein